MDELIIFKELPKRKNIYVYDDWDEIVINVFIVGGEISCKFKHKGKIETPMTFTADFIRESIRYGKEITKQEYDEF